MKSVSNLIWDLIDYVFSFSDWIKVGQVFLAVFALYLLSGAGLIGSLQDAFSFAKSFKEFVWSLGELTSVLSILTAVILFSKFLESLPSTIFESVDSLVKGLLKF